MAEFVFCAALVSSVLWYSLSSRPKPRPQKTIPTHLLTATTDESLLQRHIPHYVEHLKLVRQQLAKPLTCNKSGEDPIVIQFHRTGTDKIIQAVAAAGHLHSAHFRLLLRIPFLHRETRTVFVSIGGWFRLGWDMECEVDHSDFIILGAF